ncbi:MAG: GtrA family protein [Archangium sp.]|nr:GtrA family protein [Archangium sp.]
MFRSAWARLSQWWLARSLAIGVVSVSLDLSMGGVVLWLGGPTRLAAMCGTTVSSTITYFANRHLAFRDSTSRLAPSAMRFALMALVTNLIHGQVVVWFRDGSGIPYAFAKMLADMLVITGPQLLLMRYWVFPRPKPP